MEIYLVFLFYSHSTYQFDNWPELRLKRIVLIPGITWFSPFMVKFIFQIFIVNLNIFKKSPKTGAGVEKKMVWKDLDLCSSPQDPLPQDPPVVSDSRGLYGDNPRNLAAGTGDRKNSTEKYRVECTWQNLLIKMMANTVIQPEYVLYHESLEKWSGCCQPMVGLPPACQKN